MATSQFSKSLKNDLINLYSKESKIQFSNNIFHVR